MFLIPTTYCIGHLLILNWITIKPLTKVSMLESWISVVSNIFTPVLDCLLINHKLSVILLHFIKSFMTGITKTFTIKKKINGTQLFLWNKKLSAFCYIILLHVVIWNMPSESCTIRSIFDLQVEIVVCMIFALLFFSITCSQKTANITISVVLFTDWIKGKWLTSWLGRKIQLNHSATHKLMKMQHKS